MLAGDTLHTGGVQLQQRLVLHNGRRVALAQLAGRRARSNHPLVGGVQRTGDGEPPREARSKGHRACRCLIRPENAEQKPSFCSIHALQLYTRSSSGRDVCQSHPLLQENWSLQRSPCGTRSQPLLGSALYRLSAHGSSRAPRTARSRMRSRSNARCPGSVAVVGGGWQLRKNPRQAFQNLEK